MKKIVLILMLIISCSGLVMSQVSKNFSMKDMDLQNIKPEDIPSPEELRKLGATEEEIKMLQAIKNKPPVVNPKTITDKNPKAAKDTALYNKMARRDSTIKAQISDTIQVLPPVNIFGQEFFRNKNMNLFDKALAGKAPDNYVLAPGDKVTISVWGYSDYNESFPISSDGYIQPKETGRIYLRGVKFGDAQKLIEKRFSSFLNLKNSTMDVTLAYARTITVNIVGEVNRPGSYTIPAVNTAFNALIMAAGTNSIGSIRKIYIRRGGKVVRTLDVYNFLLNPESAEDFFLEDDDYILVPPAEIVVNVQGEVKRPFSYEMLEKEGMNDLMKYAGGIKSSGFPGAILVKRISKGKTYYEDVNLDSLNGQKKIFKLLDGDSVTVKLVPDYPEGFVEIKGAIRVPGRYARIEGERVSGLLKRAKGVMDETYLARGYIIRQNSDLSKQYFQFNLDEILKNENSPDNKVLSVYDVVLVSSKKRYADTDSITILGSIREPGKYLFGDGLKVKDALYLSGGFKKEAANNRIEISRLSNIGKGSQDTSRVIVLTAKIGYDLSVDQGVLDFPLIPYDQIFVRRLANFGYQENVKLAGEVLYPGVYSLTTKNERLFDLFERAGGLTQWAFPEGTKIIRSQDSLGYLFLNFSKADLKNAESESNYVLKEGDSIFIPKINELVAVKGSINYPGIDSIVQINTPFIKHTRAKYYVNNYGVGFAKGTMKRKTYVIYAGGFIHRTKNFGLFNIYPRVRQGSTVVAVPKITKKEKEKKQTEPVNWNKVIEGTTIKLTGLLTLYILFSQIKKL